MNARLQQLATLIHALELTPSLMDTRSRQLSHAAIYLAQQLGLDLGYNFSWQNGGPYCSKLTGDLYDLAAGPTTMLPYALNKTFAARVKRMLSLLAVPRHIQLDPPRWLLLLAATHFLMYHAKVTAGHLDRHLKSVDTEISRYREEAASILAAA